MAQFIHQQMVELHVVILFSDLGDHFSPKLRILQNVRLIDAGHFAPPLPRQLEGHVRNAFYFRTRIDHGVDRAFVRSAA